MMMKMKKYLILLVLPFFLFSCDEWLDISPEAQVEESVLFETGVGYRNALNGVYNKISQPSMYSKEMLWGFVDVLSQYYDKYSMSSSSVYYKYVSSYKYDNADVKSILDGMWSSGYKGIANCNNIIANIEKEPFSKFSGGELEKNLIKGEAIALRAFIHFDLLRLFAPAPGVATNDVYLPYCNVYPSILSNAETTESVLNKIIIDLNEAKKLVAPYDTISENIDKLFYTKGIEASNGQNGTSLSDDLFYSFRSFRMNYFAITGILSRVYNYAGNLEKAYNEAKEVFDAKQTSGGKLYDFTPDGGTAKQYEDVLFALNNKKLTEYFETYYTGSSKLLCLNDIQDMFGNELYDVRYSYIKEIGSGYWKNYVSEKYLETEQNNLIDNVNSELIPIIRLSELHYIAGEYLFSIGETEKAIEILKDVRIARGVPSELPEEVVSMDDFKRELLRDAKREFIGEGQLFYMYKRFNIKPYSRMTNESFVMPIPDSENVSL